ncbi:AAA-like domain-containing protein [Chitinophaga rupis]|nr:AAA-like domain-containing protein [Chitinophaga rupis]
MDKILKPYTIVPSSLYVQRDADRQIKNIIDDMGRPGYVLVSRQMGKTNLLLNAKRNLQSESDVFVYVDLSNPFDDARSCFENIIDTAVDTNPNKFDEIGKEILEKRDDLRNVPAHKQHTIELRLLLKSIPGKLVIILDEIDALTKTQYSDQIFAQIRSVYFSRVNYSELENLTYILSGVIEPNEIIKDAKISPFNIGQKIFLNDFNRSEFEIFLNNSKLNISDDVRDRIFYWTSGNPRMTWDLCSEIESENDVNVIKTQDIDRVVQKLYLTAYDKPPIDNIREIVKSDREIRNSIVEIEYKKGKEVSDKIKSKLYLCGIINYQDDDIHIKNEIIRRSVNLDWIKSIDEEEKGVLDVAIDYYKKEDFSEALLHFEKALEVSAFDEVNTPLYYHYMGVCQMHLRKYDQAIEYFNKANFDIQDQARYYYYNLNLKGTAYHNLNLIDESLACLSEIIRSGRKDVEYVRALINYGISCLKSTDDETKKQAESIFKDVIEERGLDKLKVKEELIDQSKSIAHMHLGNVYAARNDRENAMLHYRSSMEHACVENKPVIALSFYQILSDLGEKEKLLSHVLDLIDTKEAVPAASNFSNPLDFSIETLNVYAVLILANHYNSLFERIRPHINLLGSGPIGEELFGAIYVCIAKSITTSLPDIIGALRQLFTNFESEIFALSDETKYKISKFLTYFTNQDKKSQYYLDYLKRFKISDFDKIDFIDFEIYASIIQNYYSTSDFNKALEAIEIFHTVKDRIPSELLINSLLIKYYEAYTNLKLKRYELARENATEVLILSKDEKIQKQKSNLLGERGLEDIRNAAEVIIKTTNSRNIPIKKSRTYGRNEFVKVKYKGTSEIIESKYKKVEKDIADGKCEIYID